MHRHATVDGRRLDLTRVEFDLVLALAEQGGSTVTRRDLLASVWGYRFDPGTNVVDVHVGRLRLKLGLAGVAGAIRTIRGSGMRSAPEVDDARPARVRPPRRSAPLLLAGVTAAFTSRPLGLLAHAVQEALEEQIVIVDDLVAVWAMRSRASTSVRFTRAPSTESTTPRTRARGGARGPRTTPSDDGVGRDAFLARDGEYWSGTSGPGGIRVAAALPLRRFVRERGELATRAAIVVLIGLLGSIALGIVSARRALRPLRDTTAAIHAIDPRRLTARIPERGTCDDVDGLAAATNEVLGRLEWAFGRLAGFSADVAHELRTPVNRVLNTAEVALTTTADSDAKDDALASIHATAEAMRRTIDQLLLLAKGEDGRLRRQAKGSISGAWSVVSSSSMHRRRSGSRRAGGGSSQRHGARRSRARRARGREPARERARSLRSRGGRRVGVEAQDGHAIVVVEDSGPGIPVADRERVFGRFVRLDGARGPGGVGLGLPIARMVARLHGGELDVGTSALGGSAFRLLLPRDR